MKTTAACDWSPVPSQRIARGAQARGGMNRSVSNTGWIKARRKGDQPTPKPTANPAIGANPTPVIQRVRLSTIWSESGLPAKPSTDSVTKASRVDAMLGSPSRRPLV